MQRSRWPAMTCTRAVGGSSVASRPKIVMKTALVALALLSAAWLDPLRHQASAQTAAGVAILQVDTERRLATIDQKIYGQFLEHINHSVVDGLFAEQIRGAGFEGRDFETYWTPFGPPEAVRVVEAQLGHGTKSVRMTAGRQLTGIRQGRVFLESGRTYDGSVWIRSSRARRDLDSNDET
jgi:alpha-N-arabinofuranosidase